MCRGTILATLPWKSCIMFRCSIICLLLVLSSSCVKDPPAEEERPADITTKILVDGLQFPWEITWGADNHIWMTERGGRISRIEPSTGNVTVITTINEVVSNGEGGLLGMVTHPNFNSTPHVFVAYNYNKSGAYTEKIVRYTYNGSTLVDPFILLDDIKAANIHNGCRLVIKGDKLFISTGDAADQNLPQNIGSINGKILRLNLDGTVPSDNPIASSAIWSIGHRNAQGLVFVGDSLYSSEHGPDSDDEINVIARAGNYGWPNVRGFCEGGEENFCSTNNVIEPLKAWTPTIAVSGIDYYNSDYIPQWKNSLLVATLKGSRLLQLKLNASRDPGIVGDTSYFDGDYGRLRDVCVSPEGKVYVCTSNGGDDKVIEIGKK